MLELVTAPAAELVSTADAKTWLRVTHSSEDTLIDSLVKAARELAEHYTSRRFINQTWRLWLDRMPGRSQPQGPWWDGEREAPISIIEEYADAFIDLKLAPIVSVSSVKSYDTANVEATFDAASYLVDTKRVPGRVILNSGYNWPSGLRAKNALSTEFIVGYGAAATAVPMPIILAVKMILAGYYDNRSGGGNAESTFASHWAEIPPAATNLLDPYVIKKL